VFGSHVANVLRRLRRLALAYGTEPRFVLASATIANPVELAERLTGCDVALVDREGAPRAERRIVGQETRPAGPIELSDQDLPRDILIVVSKLKAYVRARSGMNTSDGAMDVLSDIVREIADRAIQKAAADGRKTVLDRDF